MTSAPTETGTLTSVEKELQVIGKSVPRVEGQAKVRGRTKYTDDMSLPNMLYGKLLLSDRPHARLIKIDFSKAQALPGVRTVITAEHAPDARYGIYVRDRLIFAKDVVRYVGEPIAAVAAIDAHIALEAVGLIEVTYEDLPAILEAEAALQPGMPLLHPAAKDYAAVFPYIRHGNVCFESRVSLGDSDQGFDQADLIIEETYTTPAMHQVPLEPHACLASYDHNDRLTVWTGTQQLSVCHHELSMALDLPMSQVRVIPLWLGGGFGAKLKTVHEPIVALLAKASNHPVKLVLTREEEFITTRARAPFTIRLKTGVMKDGTLIAREADILVDAGGYSDHTIGSAAHAMTTTQGSYRIPNCRAQARVVYTNNPDWGCMRGYGNTEMLFAVEAHMDEIARTLAMDPAELRYKNLWRDGDLLISSQPIFGVQIRETMDKALELSGYVEKKGRLGPNRGIGLANITKTAGLLSSSAWIKVNEDASVNVITSVIDIGTGTHTVLVQIVAETLGIPIDRIQIASQDSDNSPYDLGSIASRTVFDSGNAVRLAAEDLRDKLIGVAADTLKCSPDEITYQGGRANLRAQPDVALDFPSLVAIALYAHKGPVAGYGRWMGGKSFDKPVGEGYPEGIFPTFGFGTHVAEVEVDPETGQVEVIRITAVHDAGRVLNPEGIEGQIHGGVVQGLGFGLFEELVIKDGAIQNPNMADYRVPTALDASQITTCLIGPPDPTGPFGAKGIGEHTAVGTAPAIANAILDATGVMVRALPITPEHLYFALHQREA